MRFLFWFGLVVLVVLAIKKKLQTAKPDAPMQHKKEGNSATETMVCCARCQIYLPASEAVYRGQTVYCCNEHADLA